MFEEAFQAIAGEMKKAQETFRAALAEAIELARAKNLRGLEAPFHALLDALDQKRRSLIPTASTAGRNFTDEKARR